MIEEDIDSIRKKLLDIEAMLSQLHHILVPSKNNPSENTEKDAKFDRDNNTGDEPRYCKQCNAKLGSNKDSPSGLCKKCEKGIK